MTETLEAAVAPSLYRFRNPVLLHPILLDFIRQRNLWSVFERCADGTVECGVVSEDIVKNTEWVIDRRPLPTNCDMHWVFPANEDTFNDLLANLSIGCLGQLLRGVGSVSPASIKNLVIYNMAFAVVTYCDSLRLHVDNHTQMGSKAWTIIVPIKLADDSPPELEVQQPHSRVVTAVKYDVSHSIIFDSRTFHGTSVVRYSSGYRVCLLIAVANITNSSTAKLLLEDITAGFPPKNDHELLLNWAKKSPHWKCYKGDITVNLPSVREEVIFGEKWLRMFNIVSAACKETGSVHSIGDDPRCDASVRQWVSDQRYYYSVKHGLIEVHKSKQRYGRLMTEAREARLKDIGFVFQVPRASGLCHVRWLKMFDELRSFFDQHGHSNVTRSHNVSEQLLTWVRLQRRNLHPGRVTGKETQLERVSLLKTVKFKFRIYRK